MLKTAIYDRAAAIAYAHKWAYGYNPKYLNYDDLGGDCTNFVSQCVYAGCQTMNYLKNYGWYYIDGNKKSPSWTGVKPFYTFLTSNTLAGPYGRETSLAGVQEGDIVQLATFFPDYHHTAVIVQVDDSPTLQNTLVACHSAAADYRPLSSFPFQKLRFIHIEGART